MRYALAAGAGVICACSLLTKLDDLTCDGGCDSAASDTGGDGGARCDPTHPFGTPVLVAELEDDASTGQVAARLTPDELTLFFTHIGTSDIRTYVAMRSSANAPFGPPTEVTTIRGAGTLDAYPSITADKLNVFVEEQSDAGNVGIYQAARSNPGSAFASPKLVAELDTPGYEGQPFVAPDMSALYFARGDGSISASPLSIYVATWNGLQWHDDGLVAGGVNTGPYRSTPVITADGLTLYFSVRPDDGGGTADIFRATRSSTTAAFGAATAVDELNTAMNDSPDWISTDQCVIYLHSDRSNAFHVYRATR